jgi:hypothetical protein
MRGVLLGAFCERGSDDSSRCLELWAYPDTSLNLVVNRLSADGDEEYAFPCAPHHLIKVLKNESFRSETEDGSVVVEREADNVTAEFVSSKGDERWRHSVPVEPFQNALAQVTADVDKV